MKKPTASQIKWMRKESLSFPVELAEIPRDQWPIETILAKNPASRVLRNRKFLVQIFTHEGAVRLSVIRTEWDDRRGSWRADISWDDLQQLKREAGFGDKCAVELFPPDENVVNVANMRHLFITPCPVFMWR